MIRKTVLAVLFLSSAAVAGPPTLGNGYTPPATLKATMSVTKNTYCGAFAGLPGISVPNGRSKGGMPLGLQLESAWWGEPMLLRAGHAYQQVTDWHRMRPKAIG